MKNKLFLFLVLSSVLAVGSSHNRYDVVRSYLVNSVRGVTGSVHFTKLQKARYQVDCNSVALWCDMQNEKFDRGLFNDLVLSLFKYLYKTESVEVEKALKYCHWVHHSTDKDAFKLAVKLVEDFEEDPYWSKIYNQAYSHLKESYKLHLKKKAMQAEEARKDHEHVRRPQDPGELVKKDSTKRMK